MAAVAADYNQIHIVVIGKPVHFLGGLADDHMLALNGNSEIFADDSQTLLRLLLQLVLDLGKVHRDVTAVGKRQWLLYMNKAQLALTVAKQGLDSLDHLL